MPESFSVVVPVYNSTDSLSLLCDKVFKIYSGDDVEIILVDDGSEEVTWGKIKSIKNQYGDRLKGIRLSKNFGQHNATVCGLNFCTKKFVVTIDDDLQYLPESISVLLDKLKSTSADLVYGLPLKKKQNLLRRFSSGALQLLISVFKEKIPTASAFRIMKKEIADQLKNYKHYFVNVDAVLRWYTAKIDHCELTHHKRNTDDTGYTTLGLVRFTIRAVIAYSGMPIKLFLCSFFIAFLFNLAIFCSWLSYGTVANSLILIDIIFFTMIFALGFAILFAYMYHQTNFMSNKPCYSIAEQI